MSDLSFQYSLFARLRALEESAFPKTCANCGREYRTHEEFLTATHPVRRDHTGLKQSYDDDGAVIVDVFRNCVCGSTLLESFHDRRDTSPAGQKRRARFAEMLGSLRDVGTKDMAFVIGGPDGLAPLPGKKSGRSLAFGPQTWPHLLARALLTEQLYRALTILAGHPYHRA